MLITWVIETIDTDSAGKFRQDRVTCDHLQVSPRGDLIFGSQNEVLGCYNADVWRKFRRSSILPDQVGGNA